MFIPPMRPLLPTVEQLAPYLKRIDASRTYSNFGPLYLEFVSRLANYLGVSEENVALFANGTLALQAAIETVGNENDLWVMPSWTFVATAQAAHAARRRIHFVDVEIDTWAMKMTEYPFAAGQVVVAPFGSKPEISKWQQSPGWKVFDAASCFDACKGLGASLDDKSSMMISLHATKTLPAGEGAILVGPKEWIHKAKCWGNFGFDGTRVASGPGLNAKISEYHAAIGLAALDNWPLTKETLTQRVQASNDICDRLGVTQQPSFARGYATMTWNIRIDDADVADIELSLIKRGIGTRRWWPVGIHQMPEFRNCTHQDLSNTEILSVSTVGLPFCVDLTSDELAVIERSLFECRSAKFGGE